MIFEQFHIHLAMSIFFYIGVFYIKTILFKGNKTIINVIKKKSKYLHKYIFEIQIWIKL